MICEEVFRGQIGVNIGANPNLILIQVQAGTDTGFQQARAALTIEQLDKFIVKLQKIRERMVQG